MKTICPLLSLAVTAAALLSLGVSAVRADTIAFNTITSSTVAGPLATYGYSFTLANFTRITQLGYWDPVGNGNLNVQVALWDNSGNFLTSATVTGPASGEINNYLYVTLATPLPLNAGTYVIGGYGYPEFQTNPTFTSAPGVTLNGGRFGTGFQYPTANGFDYFGPNFQFVVPEPSTCALVGVGAAGLGFAGWRRARG